MIYGRHQGSYIIARPELQASGNMIVRVGVKRSSLGDPDCAGGWQEIARVVLTPEEIGALGRDLRHVRVEAELADWEEAWDEQREEERADR